MRIPITIASVAIASAIGCSEKPKIPNAIYEAAVIKTLHLTVGQEANICGFQRSIYFSPKTQRYYCVDYVAKTTLKDMIFVSVYDEATTSFRPIEGAWLHGLTLDIEGESLKPIKQFIPLSVEMPPQIRDSK